MFWIFNSSEQVKYLSSIHFIEYLLRLNYIKVKCQLCSITVIEILSDSSFEFSDLIARMLEYHTVLDPEDP